MLQRRIFLAAGCVLPLSSHAQSTMVGQWQGDVDGVGKARLFITAVKPNGQMEFDVQHLNAIFADKAAAGAKLTTYGVVSGTALTIETAYGGRYDLVLNGNELSGTYSRGTTFRGPASFRKS